MQGVPRADERAPSTRITFVSTDIWLGEFDLPPSHAAWQRTNQISERAPLIAFPRTSVAITHEGRPELVSDPMRVVCYSAGQPYRRRVVSAEGDRCSFLTFDGRLAAEAAHPWLAGAADSGRFAFPFSAAPIGTAEFLLQERTRRAVRDGADADAIRESLYWIVARVVGAGYEEMARRVQRSSRASTERANHDIVERVRELLGHHLGASMKLDRLAHEVGVSPFHLARVFRSRTGSSIHAYRTQLRLRSSVERIADGAPLAATALELGFASQAHLTDRFSRAFGRPPGAWRRVMAAQPGFEMSRIVKARSEIARLA